MNDAMIIDLAQQIAEAHAAVQSSVKAAVAHAIQAGELLSQAKKEMPHGTFGDFCRALPFSDRTARAYMQLAGLDQSKRQRVADLSLRQALLAVAERPEPPDAKEEASKYAELSARMNRSTRPEDLARDVVSVVEQASRAFSTHIAPDLLGAYRELAAYEKFVSSAMEHIDQSLDWAEPNDIAGLAFIACEGSERIIVAIAKVGVAMERRFPGAGPGRRR